jgi:hypothetical protein
VATPLAALDPHQRRFGLHPLQTFTNARGPEQLDGAWAAVTAETATRGRGFWLADLLGLRPFDIRDESRLLYHAGAVFASNYLVTLYRSACRLFELAGAPPEALIPLMRRTMDNGFDLTGPIAGATRGRQAHLAELEARARSRAAVSLAGQGDSRMNLIRSVVGLRRALEPFRRGSTIGLVPTMGALHEGHVALLRAARREADCVVASLFVNPAQFGDPADLAAYPRDEAHDARLMTAAGVDYLFAPSLAAMYPPGFDTWVEAGGAALGLEGDYRPGHFRGVATVCLKLFTIVAPQLAFL